MTWEGFWWPQLAGALVNVAVAAIIGAPVGLIARHYWRAALDPIRAQLEGVSEDAQQASTSASQGASDASLAVTGQRDVARRLQGVEGAVDGLKDGVSASLGHRVHEDLRFRAIEQVLGLPDGGRISAGAAGQQGAEGDRRRGRRAAGLAADVGEPDARE